MLSFCEVPIHSGLVKELILSYHSKPIKEQGIALDKFITDFQKDIEQIDDILVIGVRV